jgi:hypothetical protein
MKRKKNNHQKRIHPQSDPQGLYKTSQDDWVKNGKLPKRDLKTKKIDADLTEEMDHPE